MTETVSKISKHINDLALLGKTLSIDANIETMEKETLIWMKDDFGGNLWRGADIQVVNCSPGSKYPDWKNALIQYNYSVEEPCPSRFPVMMTGLINRIQEKAEYLDAYNKYEFYYTIAKNAQALELNNENLDKQTICREIVFKQLQLLASWRNELSQEMDNPSLLDQGWKIYFGYGRNANQEAMLSANRCPDAQLLGPASLENHKFIIDEAGYASVEHESGSTVFGMLWAVSPADFNRLDLREGLRIGSYRKDSVYVTPLMRPFDDAIEAVVYISNRPEGSVPADGYIEEIIDGMISGGVSRDQIAYLYRFLNIDAPEPKSPIIDNSSFEQRTFLPKDSELPFFAYGLFKSDQIAHARIRPYIANIVPTIMDGCFLAERDGIPLLGSSAMINDAPDGYPIPITKVHGEVISFKPGKGAMAYSTIADLEPSNIYTWSIIDNNGEQINVLAGKRIFKGSQSLQMAEWDMRRDDAFVAGLEAMLDRLLNDSDRRYEVIELQAAYIMLWSGIERLIALKHSFKESTEKDILEYLEENREIQNIFNSISEKPEPFRPIYLTKKPKDKIQFIPQNTKKCLIYLRSIRHNVVHRGKAGMVDTDLTFYAIEFSRKIFQKLYQF